jgi:hypothetical protein
MGMKEDSLLGSALLGMCSRENKLNVLSEFVVWGGGGEAAL